MVKNGTYAAFFDEQQKWGNAIREKFEAFDVRNKSDVDKFAEDNADITEELQLSMERANYAPDRGNLKQSPLKMYRKVFH